MARGGLARSRAGLLALDLGAAHNRPAGYLGVNQYPGPDVDIVATLPSPLDLPDGSIGVIRAHDFLVFGVVSIGSLSAGGLLEIGGWQTVNWTVLPLLAVALLTVVWLALIRSRLELRLSRTRS